MSGRIQYLLIVLLFVLTGDLAGYRAEAQPASNSECAIFMQTNPLNQVENTLVYHSAYAPEAMTDSQSEVSSYKVPAVTALLPGYRTEAFYVTTENPTNKSDDSHPRPADYFIFGLEKILI